MAATEGVLSERLCSTKRRPPASWRAQKACYSVGGRACYSVGGRANNSRLSQLRSPLSAREP